MKTKTLDKLSPREKEVFRLVGKGFSPKEIAGQLGLAPKTVDVHKLNIRHKLGVADQHKLTMLAVRHQDSGSLGGAGI